MKPQIIVLGEEVRKRKTMTELFYSEAGSKKPT